MCTKLAQDRFSGVILRTMPYLVTLFVAAYLKFSGKMEEMEDVSWIDTLCELNGPPVLTPVALSVLLRRTRPLVESRVHTCASPSSSLRHFA